MRLQAEAKSPLRLVKSRTAPGSGIITIPLWTRTGLRWDFIGINETDPYLARFIE
ncbi:hypothetical protein SRABI83_03233 [Arthrobacter sp. Bi83]|nr:hypothetical protein SRABI83_03233 [Arthrobacter sp. Bi83]